MVAFLVLLYGVYVGVDDDLRRGPRQRAVPRRRIVRDHDRAGDRRRRADSRSRVRSRCCPSDLEKRLAALGGRPAPASRALCCDAPVARARGAAPALAASGVRTASHWCATANAGLLGALGLVGLRHARAVGHVPRLRLAAPDRGDMEAYFVGMLGNLLPLPGGLGGVEGGMIGAFAAFGVSLDLAVLAVLTYRPIAFWLPTLPGAIAYFQLRRTVAHWRAEQGAAGRWEPPRRAAAAEPAHSGT